MIQTLSVENMRVIGNNLEVNTHDFEKVAGCGCPEGTISSGAWPWTPGDKDESVSGREIQTEMISWDTISKSRYSTTIASIYRRREGTGHQQRVRNY